MPAHTLGTAFKIPSSNQAYYPEINLNIIISILNYSLTIGDLIQLRFFSVFRIIFGFLVVRIKWYY